MYMRIMAHARTIVKDLFGPTEAPPALSHRPGFSTAGRIVITVSSGFPLFCGKEILMTIAGVVNVPAGTEQRQPCVRHAI